MLVIVQRVRLADAISIARILAVPIILGLVLWHPPSLFVPAAAIFLIAAISDLLDGYIARRSGKASTLGIYLDLVADKILTSCVLLVFVDLGILPTWPAALIITREFIVSGLRTVAAAEGLIIPAAAWGKHKTLVTNVAIFMLFIGFAGSQLPANISISSVTPMQILAYFITYIAVVLTITSGLRYVYNARYVLFQMMKH